MHLSFGRSFGPPPRAFTLVAACLVVVAALWLALGPQPAIAQPASVASPPGAVGPAAPAVPANPLAAAKSWGYQLQAIDPATIAASPHDVVVIDFSRDGSEWRSFSPGEIARMKVKPDGSRRQLISYMSIGEAESYRFYWRKRWSWMAWGGWRWFWQLFGDRFVPAWLGPHNTEWQGNYGVRYWDPGWQAIMIDGEDSYLSRVMAAGFDGVYLDKIDGFVDMAPSNPNSRRDMIAFVLRLASVARAKVPGFLIVPQNGEELLRDATYRATIDALGKEDLLFGDPKDKIRNPPDATQRNVEDLQRLTAAGKPVFSVEYLREPALIVAARQELTGYGFVPLFADRALADMRSSDNPTNARDSRR